MLGAGSTAWGGREGGGLGGCSAGGWGGGCNAVPGGRGQYWGSVLLLGRGRGGAGGLGMEVVGVGRGAVLAAALPP